MNKNIFKEKLKKKYGYRLTGGDTIKFGRVRFIVKVISDSDYEAKPTLIMREEDDEEEEKNEGEGEQRDKTLEAFDRFNENENFADPQISQRNRNEEEPNMNQLKKSLKILQTIPKQSYESSLFFDMMNKPVEDFMSERSSQAEDKYKDDEIVVDLVEKEPTEDKVCRICLGNETEDEDCSENPLFAPCICAGTMKYVHLDCMKQWVHAKRHSKEGDRVKSYNWKNLECELCKHKIHEEFEFKGKKYYLLDYYRPSEGHYLILESFTNTPHKTIHVISFSEEESKRKKDYLIKVGRGAEVDVRITDISVSREHSKIYFSKGEFYCIDNYSKFGTVALLRQPISLPQKGEFYFQLQVGKHLLEVESESHLNCCFCNITNRTNKKFKGPKYSQFKHLLPPSHVKKLDLLENLTKVLETQNIEDAEDNLNREITRLKLANESLISQRTILQKPQMPTTEDAERLYSQDLRISARQYTHTESPIDQTNPQISEMNTINDMSKRKVVPLYNDSTLNMTNDVNVTLRHPDLVSRNTASKGLMKQSSTKERLKEQESMPSGNQFTLNEEAGVVGRGNGGRGGGKVEQQLYEEYKHPDTIEEEKKEVMYGSGPVSPEPPRFGKEIDEEEEEKKGIVLKRNVFLKKDVTEPNSEQSSQVENLKKVIIKPGLHIGSKPGSRRVSADSSGIKSSAKVSNNWVSGENTPHESPQNLRQIQSSERNRDDLIRESDQILRDL